MRQWVLFCEGKSDYRTVPGLIDRALAEKGPEWVQDALRDGQAEVVRRWREDARGEAWFDLHQVRREAVSRGVRLRQGHFDGEPGAPGAQTVSNVIRLTRALQRETPPDEAIEAVVFVWDLDDDPDNRRKGVAQGLAAEGSFIDGALLVVGLANPNREAWVLVGFDPTDAAERARLEAERETLGFQPHEEPEQLTAMKEQAQNHTKRVLSALCGGDRNREAQCWQKAPYETLRARGEGCGLRAFLDEVERELVPLVSRP